MIDRRCSRLTEMTYGRLWILKSEFRGIPVGDRADP